MSKTNLGSRRGLQCKMDLVLLRLNLIRVMFLKMASLLVLLVGRSAMGNVKLVETVALVVVQLAIVFLLEENRASKILLML